MKFDGPSAMGKWAPMAIGLSDILLSDRVAVVTGGEPVSVVVSQLA
jgi:hypothetical protein